MTTLRLPLALFCSMVCWLSPTRVFAEDWAVLSGGWSDINSWTQMSVPDGDSAAAIFPGPTSNSNISLTGGPFTVNQLTFQGGTALVYSLQSGTLIMDGANATISVGPGSGSGTVRLIGGAMVQLDAAVTIDTTDPTSFFYANAGSFTGAGELIKTGPGKIQTDVASDYTGETTISAGSLVVSSGGTLGSDDGGTTVDSGAELQLRSGVVLVNEQLTIFGSGISGEGALRSIIGSNSFNGNILLGSDARIGSGVAGQTLTINPSLGDAIAGVFAIVFGGAGHTNVGAPIVNDGDVTKEGGGILTLNDVNSYTGDTNLNGGTLRVGAGINDAIPDGSAVSIMAGATFDVFGNTETIGSLAGVSGSTVSLGGGTLTTGGNNASTTYAGGISGSGGLIKEGTGILILTGTSNYSGPTTISEGTLIVDGNLASSVTVTSNGRLGGNGSIGGGLTLSNGTAMDFELGAASDPLTLTGGVFSASGGITTLNFSDGLGFVPGIFTLIDFSGLTTDGFTLANFTIGSVTFGSATDYTLDLTNDELTVTVVPEPAVGLILTLGTATLGLRRRRRGARG